MLKKIFQPLTVFVLSAMFLALIYGFAAATFSWFPSSILGPPLTTIHQQLMAAPPAPHNLRSRRHEFTGVIEHTEGRKTKTGEVDLTLISSFWKQDDGRVLPGFQLIQRDGHVVHEWIVDILALWSTSPHKDSVAGAFVIPNNYLHGSYLFPNGDIVFNVDFLGLVRMAPDGKIVWRLDRRTHHSVFRNTRGNFWVCESQWLEDPKDVIQRFPGLMPAIAEDRALEVSPDGEIVREVSILEVVFNSEHRQKLWKKGLPGRTGDVIHLNDVEELSAEMAADYPLFSAGDLVVSLRNIDLVMVFDPESGAIRWASDRPHLGQHDPDFIGDGRISIFDNHADSTLYGAFLGGSRMLSVRPHEASTEVFFADSKSPPRRRFHTEVGGKAQQLEDGHWLLTETTGGRIVEINAAGEFTWEWAAEPVDDAGKMIPEVYEGSRYTLRAEDVLHWGDLGS